MKEIGFVNACELSVGDKLTDSDGKVMFIESVNTEVTDEAVKVYNFQVEGTHTYYVSDECILVHNADGNYGDSSGNKVNSYSVNPNEIRFSQTSVNGSEEIIASMKKNGWNGPPIDIVEMPDGISTTIDNTRVVSARQAGINVEANIHSYNNTEDIPRLCRRRVLSFRSVGVQSPTVWSAILRIASAC